MNKPFDVLSQFTLDHPGQLTLKDYISIPNVYAAGRLDRDSEGLLLLTDDGTLQHRLAEPRYGHERTYWAQVEGIPDATGLAKLAKGVVIQGYQTRAARAELLTAEPELWPRDPPIRFRKAIPTSWLQITLTEGRNRQVRRMTAAIGHPTLRLIRVAIGHLQIDGLKPGESRELQPREIQPFLSSP